MKIVCPECQKENRIVVQGGTKCRKCDKSLDGHKFIKPLMPAIMPAILLIAMGVGGTEAFEYVTEDSEPPTQVVTPAQSRYPVRIEYSLVDHCIAYDERAMKKEVLKKRRDTCLCAVEETMKEFSFSEFNEDQYAFVKKYKENTSICAVLYP